jgi:hypothetical protein
MLKNTTMSIKLLNKDSLNLKEKLEQQETSSLPLNQRSLLPLEPEGKFVLKMKRLVVIISYIYHSRMVFKLILII